MVENVYVDLEDLNKDPQQLLKQWKLEAERVKADFYTKDLLQIKTDDPHQLFEYLKEVLHASTLFMDDDMKKKLTGIGIGHHILLWLIPIERIYSELDKIKSDGYGVLPLTNTLVYIKAHLTVNWLTDLQIAFGYTNTVNKKEHSPALKLIIYRLYKNRNKKSGQFPAARNTEVQKLIDMIQTLEKFPVPPKLIEKTLKQLTSGNTKKLFLKEIVKYDEKHPRTNKYYRSFYWLFSLLLPNTYFMNQEDYESQSQVISESYPAYQARIVKNLIR